MIRSGGLRLLGGAAGIITAVLLGADPAMAASRTIEWTSPTLGDPVLRETGKIAVMTHNDDGRSTDKIEITIDNPFPANDPCSPSPLVSSVRPPSGTRGAVPFEVDVAFPCNGAYSVVAKAWNTRQGIDAADMWSSTLPLRVAMPPAPVAGLSSTGWVASGGDDETGRIELQWLANTELDLIGYRIDRAVNDQSLVTLTEIGAGVPTSFVDADLPVAGARYTYKLVAIRKGPSGDDRVDSGAPVMVVVTAGKPVSDPIVGVPVTTTTPPTTLPKAPPSTKTITPLGSAAESAERPGAKAAAETSGETGGLSRTIELEPQSSDEPAPPSETPTTVDTGYADRLPFSADADAGADDTEGGGDIFEELGAGEETSQRRTVLVPVASGLILVVGWMFVRLIRRELAHAEAAEEVDLRSRAQWSMVTTSGDDTAQVLTRREVQAARRNELPTGKQRV